MDEEQIRQIVREELSRFLKSDKFVFDKLTQFLDGRNIQTGRANGTSICTATDQKIGFYGQTAIQQSKINDPSGGLTVDGEARSIINSIIDVLEAYGLTAS